MAKIKKQIIDEHGWMRAEYEFKKDPKRVLICVDGLTFDGATRQDAERKYLRYLLDEETIAPNGAESKGDYE